jgi:hypothetical protein
VHLINATAKHMKKKVTMQPRDTAAESCDPRGEAAKELREFFVGPGYPGISKNWRGREALYAERENQLLRRYRRRNDQS